MAKSKSKDNIDFIPASQAVKSRGFYCEIAKAVSGKLVIVNSTSYNGTVRNYDTDKRYNILRRMSPESRSYLFNNGQNNVIVRSYKNGTIKMIGIVRVGKEADYELKVIKSFINSNNEEKEIEFINAVKEVIDITSSEYQIINIRELINKLPSNDIQPPSNSLNGKCCDTGHRSQLIESYSSAIAENIINTCLLDRSAKVFSKIKGNITEIDDYPKLAMVLKKYQIIEVTFFDEFIRLEVNADGIHIKFYIVDKGVNLNTIMSVIGNY